MAMAQEDAVQSGTATVCQTSTPTLTQSGMWGDATIVTPSHTQIAERVPTRSNTRCPYQSGTAKGMPSPTRNSSSRIHTDHMTDHTTGNMTSIQSGMEGSIPSVPLSIRSPVWSGTMPGPQGRVSCHKDGGLRSCAVSVDLIDSPARSLSLSCSLPLSLPPSLPPTLPHSLTRSLTLPLSYSRSLFLSLSPSLSLVLYYCQYFQFTVQQ